MTILSAHILLELDLTSSTIQLILLLYRIPTPPFNLPFLIWSSSLLGDLTIHSYPGKSFFYNINKNTFMSPDFLK